MKVFGRHPLVALIALLAIMLSGVFLGKKVFSQPTFKVIYLKPEQETNIKKVDTMLQGLQKQYESMVQQRGALITGVALSTDEVKASGLDWAKEYEFAEDKTGYGFRKLTEDEKKQRAVQGQAAGQ